MSMTTQCPSCSTTFRVTPQQLQSQQGMVRCGRCATVFDGFMALATMPEEVRPEPLTRSAEPATAAVFAPPMVESPPPAFEPEAAPAVPAPAVADEQIDAPVEPVAVEPEAPQEIIEPEVVPPTVGATAPQALAESAPEPETAPVAVAAQASTAVPHTERAESAAQTPAPKRRGLIWAFASVLLLAILGAQFVYMYRGEIAASVPEARPLLTEWCKRLNCTVALPQRPRQITIEASDMQAADNANAGLVILTATLRNQATIALGYPALDVVLTNTRDHTVARRIFLPHEYLAENREWRAGMAPSAEVTIRLQIDSGDLGAAGFRLELMAAPAT